MVFGVAEDLIDEDGDERDDDDFVEELFNRIKEKSSIVECHRVGIERPENPRPLKVKLKSSDAVNDVLRKAKDLKHLSDCKYIFISPDRSREERSAHKELVEQMKNKIKEDASKHYFIKNNKVCSVDRSSSTSNSS